MIRGNERAGDFLGTSGEVDDARYLHFLLQAGEILSESLDYHQTLKNVCMAAVQTVADVCFLDLERGGEIEFVATAFRTPERYPELQNAGAYSRPITFRPERVIHQVIATGQAILIPEVDEQYIAAQSNSREHANLMARVDFRSLIIVPIVSRSQGTLGALTLIRTLETKQRYDSKALDFALDLARRCGSAIGKAMLHAEVLEVATQFQRAALPKKLPSRESFFFDAYYEPANSRRLVGGDWFDAFDLPDGRIGITVGDVLDHGVEAAVLMSSIRNSLRAALYLEPNLVRAIEAADLLMRAEAPDSFATAITAILDVEQRTLSCLSAGHPGPLIWKDEKVFDPFLMRGFPIGLRDLGRSSIELQTIPMHPGDLAVFFSDGLIEWNKNADEATAVLVSLMLREDIRRHPRLAKALRDEVILGEHQDDVVVLTLQARPLGIGRE